MEVRGGVGTCFSACASILASALSSSFGADAPESQVRASMTHSPKVAPDAHELFELGVSE